MPALSPLAAGRSRLLVGAWLVCLATAVVGCRQEDDRVESRAASTSRGVVATPVPAPAPSSDTVHAQPIHWNPQHAGSMLVGAGFAPQQIPLGRPRFPNVNAAAYRVGETDVEMFFFGDQLAAARAMSRLGVLPSATTAFTSNNMVVLIRGGDAATRDRLQTLLTRPETRATLSP